MPQSKRPPPWPTRPGAVSGTPLPFGHDESASTSLSPSSVSAPRYPTIPREARSSPHMLYSGPYPQGGAGSPMEYTPTPATDYMYSPASSYSGVPLHSPAYLPRPAPDPSPLLDNADFRPPSRPGPQGDASRDSTAAEPAQMYNITPSTTTLQAPPHFRDPAHHVNPGSEGRDGVGTDDMATGTRRGAASEGAVRDPSKRARRMLLPPRTGATLNDPAHVVNFGRGVPNVAAPLGHRIFGYMSAEDRSRASRVCRQWNRFLSSPASTAGLT